MRPGSPPSRGRRSWLPRAHQSRRRAWGSGTYLASCGLTRASQCAQEKKAAEAFKLTGEGNVARLQVHAGAYRVLYACSSDVACVPTPGNCAQDARKAGGGGGGAHCGF